MNTIVRGAAVYITVIFKDEAGQTISPSNASIRLQYSVRNRRKTDIIALTNDGGGNWSTVWDSSVSNSGSVEWWAQSADAPKAACQGKFSLAANAANPEP
jgi:hypothetical protein